MLIPFISSRNTSSLGRRAGGGGKGKGSSSTSKPSPSSSSSKPSTSSSSSSGSGKTKTPKKKTKSKKSKSKYPDLEKQSSISPFMMGGAIRSASVYGYGGGAASVIPAGEAFAGRTVGGWSRDQIFGTKTYGSGYPGINGRGTAGRGFPFYFWPVVWTGAAGAATGAGAFVIAEYLSGGGEYGAPNNSTRPGGAMAAALFPSDSNSSVFRVVADTATVKDLIEAIKSNCSSPLDNSASSSSPSPYENYPRPDQVIQYFRGSSIALTLDGYSNNATNAPEGTSDTPLPGGVDMTLLDCLNQTIGAAAPLVDGASGHAALPPLGLVGLVYVVWNLMGLL